MTNDATTGLIDLTQAEFVKEAHVVHQLPADSGAEIAFAGRSNAGKSSVINALCRRRKLARTSRTPGRTQRFVVFEFAPGRRFIDLPGFGYAKVAKTQRDHWSFEIPRYLESRACLIGLVLVADARHPLKPQEREILAWCAAADLHVLLLLNKCDKLNQRESARAVRDANKVLDDASGRARARLFSAATGAGVEEVTRELSGWFARQSHAEEEKKGPR